MEHKKQVYFLLCMTLVFISTAYSKCPTTKRDWDRRALTFECTGDIRYLCLKNEENYTTEICLPVSIFFQNACPILVRGQMRLVACDREGCPYSSYLSYELYKYPICFGENLSKIRATTGINPAPEIKYSKHHITTNALQLWKNLSKRRETPTTENALLDAEGPNGGTKCTSVILEIHKGDRAEPSPVKTHILITCMAVNACLLIILCVTIRIKRKKEKENRDIHPQPLTSLPDTHVYNVIPEF